MWSRFHTIELLNEEQAEFMRAHIQRHPLIARHASASPRLTNEHVDRMVRQFPGLRIARGE